MLSNKLIFEELFPPVCMFGLCFERLSECAAQTMHIFPPDINLMLEMGKSDCTQLRSWVS